VIRPRVADLKPSDSWLQDELHFFVFQLRPEPEEEPPLAVFAMHHQADGPVSAVVVTPRQNGADAEVLDLCRPESVYTTPMAD
jgi:hypothetical protein